MVPVRAMMMMAERVWVTRMRQGRGLENIVLEDGLREKKM
jgi:hypothetical protein